MQIKFLTLYTPVVKGVVNPSDVSQTSLALVIGTSNSLYKLVNTGRQDQVQINSIIIDTWLEMIEPLREKVKELLDQLGSQAENPIDKSIYLRFEIQDENTVALFLLQVFEQIDRAIIILDARVQKGFSKEKYSQILEFFIEQAKAVMSFPYHQNKNLNTKLLNLSL